MSDEPGKGLEPVDFRMDMVIEDVVTNEDDRSFTVSFRPDPARYERRTRADGRSGWFDLLDHLFLPDEVVAEMLASMPSVPMYHQAPKISDARVYAEGRREQVEAALQGPGIQGPNADPSGDFLDSLAEDRLGFAILVVDTVGSTRLSQSLSPEVYARVVSVVVTELAEVVPLFNGHVLKHTGDGLIAYFPEPSLIRMNDMSIDCAMTMTRVLTEAINPALQGVGHPTLNLRLGLESGDAYVVTLGTLASKRHRDLIGAVINIAAKIQAAAAPGDVVVGESMDRHLHNSWRRQLQGAAGARGMALCGRVRAALQALSRRSRSQPRATHKSGQPGEVGEDWLPYPGSTEVLPARAA